MKYYVCIKLVSGIFEGGSWYGNEPYAHSFVEKTGDECEECIAVKQALNKEKKDA